MAKDLRQLVIEEFSGENAQRMYKQKATEGFWDSEKRFISKYFVKKKALLLDMGCGTGRTTMPLVKKGFVVVGVDLVPAMIKNAKKIAKQKGLRVDYRVGDATKLKFKKNTFDYCLFSNQGLTQIPGKENRLKAMKEIFRVLKPGGLFMFTAHPRVYSRQFGWFWIRQWFRIRILKPLGVKVDEIDFGDRFFDRETSDKGRTFKSKQYIHIPACHEMRIQMEDAGFKVVEINGDYQIRPNDTHKHPPVFYIGKKVK